MNKSKSKRKIRSPKKNVIILQKSTHPDKKLIIIMCMK